MLTKQLSYLTSQEAATAVQAEGATMTVGVSLVLRHAPHIAARQLDGIPGMPERIAGWLAAPFA